MLGLLAAPHIPTHYGVGGPGGERDLGRGGSRSRGNSLGARTASDSLPGLQHSQQMGSKFFNLEGGIWVPQHPWEDDSRS